MEARDDVNTQFAAGSMVATHLHYQRKHRECFAKALELLASPGVPKYHQLKLLILLCYDLGLCEEAIDCYIEAENLWQLLRRQHIEGEVEVVDCWIAETRLQLHRVKRSLMGDYVKPHASGGMVQKDRDAHDDVMADALALMAGLDIGENDDDDDDHHHQKKMFRINGEEYAMSYKDIALLNVADMRALLSNGELVSCFRQDYDLLSRWPEDAQNIEMSRWRLLRWMEAGRVAVRNPGLRNHVERVKPGGKMERLPLGFGSHLNLFDGDWLQSPIVRNMVGWWMVMGRLGAVFNVDEIQSDISASRVNLQSYKVDRNRNQH